jgi:UDP-N-acetylmuramate dehydrogenase
MRRLNEPLKNYNSFRVGGPAKQLFIPENLKELQQFLQHLPRDEKIFWLGLGSNLLIRDEGFNGTVIIIQGVLTQMNFLPDTVVRIEAGIACGTAARNCARNNLTGIEFLAGVPGTIGGALAMNAGAHGNETWQWVTQCETINRQGEIRCRPYTDYQAEYRQVIRPQDEWFIAGFFKLKNAPKEENLAKINAFLAHRKATQPINLPNCGSVFRNPPGHFAAKLIESCGLKGYRIGGAAISTKHANFIVNDQEASAADIENIIKHIEKTVQQKHGITLIREVHFLGEVSTHA